MATAREELREAKPALWMAFLLGFTVGLRRGEIDSLTWTQVRFDKGSIWVRVSERFEAKSDGSENEIFVDESIMSELKWWQSHPDCKSEYVLPGRSKMPLTYSDYRCDKTVFDPLLKWLRKNGDDEQKPIQTLRKEFGSFIAANGDIHVAQNQLRQSQISKTARYYAENRRRIAPKLPVPELQVLNPPKEAK